MELQKDIILGLKMRISDLKAKEADLKKLGNPLSVTSVAFLSLLDIQSRLEELSAILAAFENLVKQEPSGPTVKSNIQLGNIEQCFLEQEMMEMEEDYFDGY